MTRIDPNDFDSVVWLQKALTRLLKFPQPMMVGEFDFMVWKAIQNYQEQYGLTPVPLPASAHRERPPPLPDMPPQTRAMPPIKDQDEVLAALLKHINQQLKERGLTVS